jgi:hypothetical protein
MRSRTFAAVAVLVAAALALAGCGSTQWAGSASVGGSTAVPVAPIAPAAAAAGGTTVVTGPQGGYVSINVSGSVANFIYWMTGVGIYAAMLMDEHQYNGGAPLFPLPMREDRKVAEVDCTKPIPEELIGNIRCR